MRIGLDLRNQDRAAAIETAQEADRVGIWAVLVGGEPGTEIVAAAELAALTEHVHIGIWLRAEQVHPLGIAEEIAVIDHLSQRRALTIIDGPAEVADHVARLLAGHIVDGTALTPPPAQTTVPVWKADAVSVVELTGDLEQDRVTIDDYRDQGQTHLFVTWPDQIRTLARHLVSRAAAPGFPQITADHADVIAP